MASASPDVIRAVGNIVVHYRDHLADVLDRAALPHDLPSGREALNVVTPGQPTGPKKPVLVRAFKRMGYEYRASRACSRSGDAPQANLANEGSIELARRIWQQLLGHVVQGPG